jgi:hypothetical protein
MLLIPSMIAGWIGTSLVQHGAALMTTAQLTRQNMTLQVQQQGHPPMDVVAAVLF